jgi:hypothetical protein
VTEMNVTVPFRITKARQRPAICTLGTPSGITLLENHAITNSEINAKETTVAMLRGFRLTLTLYRWLSE